MEFVLWNVSPKKREIGDRRARASFVRHDREAQEKRRISRVGKENARRVKKGKEEKRKDLWKGSGSIFLTPVLRIRISNPGLPFSLEFSKV